MAKGATTSMEAAGLNAAGEWDGVNEGCLPWGRLTWEVCAAWGTRWAQLQRGRGDPAAPEHLEG